MCLSLHLTPSTCPILPYDNSPFNSSHLLQVSSYPLTNVLNYFKCFMGGIQVKSCYLLCQSHVISKLDYITYYINHMWLIYNIQKIWLLISRFTKQFPSNDFYKHFICFKLLITLYLLLCLSYFKLIYNCVSNKCSLYLYCFIKLMP